jgi:hypothetical protein
LAAALLTALLAALAGLVLAALLLARLVLAALLLARLARLVLAGVILLVLRIVLFVRHRDVLRRFGVGTFGLKPPPVYNNSGTGRGFLTVCCSNYEQRLGITRKIVAVFDAMAGSKFVAAGFRCDHTGL